MKQKIGLIVLVLGLVYLYFYPGLNPVITGPSNLVMSDDSDPAALPYVYGQVIDTWKNFPSRMFYGAVYSDTWEPEKGTAVWTPWSERWIAVLTSYFVPIEQISTMLVVLLAMANFFAMYGLSRYLSWSKSVSIGLAICWAFSAFTRARAKVHMSMTGIYHIPLLFLGLLLIARGKSWKSAALASLCFLLVGTTTHYFVITTAFLGLFFLVFLFLQPEFRVDWKSKLVRLVVSVVPLILFLGFNFLKPIPSGTRMSLEDSVPKTGEAAPGQLHPFLYYYAADPIDYLTGDIALQVERTDINPLRQSLNEYVVANMKTGNPHEHTNGVRWLLWLFIIFGGVSVAFRCIKLGASETNSLLFFVAFGVFAFLLSMPPDYLPAGLAPSGWLYGLVKQIRVTNRAGVFVHFSVLMITGYLLTAATNAKWKKWLLFPGVFPALMILDYPPLFQKMPMAEVRAPFAQLSPVGGSCETGMYFPFFNPNTDVPYYYFMQRLRGTDCRALNGLADLAQNQYLANMFPPSMELIKILNSEPRIAQNLIRMAKCIPLNWIVFDPVVDPQWRQSVCDQLGWKMNPDLSCVDPGAHKPFAMRPDRCMAISP